MKRLFRWLFGRLTTIPKRSDEVSAAVTLSGPDWQLQTKISVPKGRTQLRQLMPAVQSFADSVVIDAGVKAAEQQGRKISCKKGCAACCRQLVPIPATEAYYIRDVVANLPESRRAQVYSRFAAARRRLDDSGLLDKLLHPEKFEWPDNASHSFGLEYFRLGIPCPFLEEEACSIYADRPLACRDYLVTSPAENCDWPAGATVQAVKMPLKVWKAIAHFDPVPPPGRFIRWVPLILVLEWAEAHPQEPPPRPGPELLQEFVNHLLKTGNALAESEALPSETLRASG
jgi:Fe-S-cluster containining protein